MTPDMNATAANSAADSVPPEYGSATWALIVALLTGSMALALRFDDFERTEPL
jgi:hypothetical protein